MRGIMFASITGVTSLLFHATVDFNFHIFANAAYFYVLVAMGLVAALTKQNRNSHQDS